jgi:hypothetical protein
MCRVFSNRSWRVTEFARCTTPVKRSVPIQELILIGKYSQIEPGFDSVEVHDEICADQLEISLLGINHKIGSLELLAVLDEIGFYPVGIRELLSLSISYPDALSKGITIALATKVENFDGESVPPIAHVASGTFVPYYVYCERGRSLGFFLFDTLWDRSCRFVCVRK